MHGYTSATVRSISGATIRNFSVVLENYLDMIGCGIQFGGRVASLASHGHYAIIVWSGNGLEMSRRRKTSPGGEQTWNGW